MELMLVESRHGRTCQPCGKGSGPFDPSAMEPRHWDFILVYRLFIRLAFAAWFLHICTVRARMLAVDVEWMCPHAVIQ